MYIANGQDPEHGEGPGHLWCVDITKKGDISRELGDGDAEAQAPARSCVGAGAAGQAARASRTRTAASSGTSRSTTTTRTARSSGDERMNRTISTVAVDNGLVFAPDFSGFLHCLDAKTGKHYWTYDMEAAIWGSPLVGRRQGLPRRRGRRRRDLRGRARTPKEPIADAQHRQRRLRLPGLRQRHAVRHEPSDKLFAIAGREVSES